MTPVMDVPDDQELDALLDAARIIVDNGRQGPTCCYAGRTHDLGTNHNCALCRLSRALKPYTD